MESLPDDLQALRRLLDIMDRLRDPDGGCPWDLEQTFETIAPYTIEEAYEVADAIERRDYADLESPAMRLTVTDQGIVVLTRDSRIEPGPVPTMADDTEELELGR